jgi:alkanesulfonate monooxygenase SsuD/methylene tetrahydromethanopterin reductase-like flavin-dependent oxidoreductase (luciferase family)
VRFAINLPAFNAFADARELADLAHDAEDAGWDGFFLWDHLQTAPNGPVADPWVALSAIAMRTEHIRIGTLVTPLPRRRPWKFARETTTLDHLSHGRLIVGVGIGGDFWREYSAFGEADDDKTHAALLDESLDVVTGLWSGEPFSYQGAHYTVRNAQFLPTPAQAPRIPIWVANVWPNKRPLRRAARWDGVYPIHWDGHPMQPDEIREMLAYIHQYRSSDARLEVVVAGYVGNQSPTAATALLRTYSEAGVTWWQEGFSPNDTRDMVRARIRQGPPSL